MRRSAAPSARNSNSATCKTSLAANENITSKNNPLRNIRRSTSNILQLLSSNKGQISSSNPESNKGSENVNLIEKTLSQPEVSTDKVYNIVWGKKSTKKHKTWEGDGILLVKDKSVTLKDEEGKVMGRLTNFNVTLIEEGYIFSVGGKEVQIIELVSSVPPKNVSAKREKPGEDTKIMPPKKIIKRNLHSKTTSNVDASHKLVLPEPSLQHQWQHNESKARITEVVIAGCLSRVLRPHQRQGVVFLYECVMGLRTPDHYGAILADEMGLGKTLQAITLIWTLLKQGPYGGMAVIRRALIVTPSSLTGNWGRELTRWLAGQRLCVYTVDTKHKLADYQPATQPILIISYDMFIRCSQQIREIGFNLMVCDEGHRLKNENIKLTVLLNQLECKRRILLTGTPIQNDLQEFYSLANFVNPGILGNNIEYRQNYIDPIVKSREPEVDAESKKLGAEKALELNRKIGAFVLRRTQDILEKFLPTKTEMVIFCKSSNLQRQMYSEIIDFWHNRDSSEINALSVIIALKKICNHPFLLKNNEDDCDDKVSTALKEILQNVKSPQIQDSGKVRLLFALLANLPASEKLVIVSSYTQTLDMLASLCAHASVPHCRLDGNTASAQRTRLVERFNSPRSVHKVLLLSAKAGGVGLNLVGANRLVLFDIDWNPAIDLQAMARVWRDGQKRNVYLYRFLTAGTIEEKIYQRQISKLGLSGAVVDPETTNSIRLSDEELRRLFTVESDFYDGCLTHASLECVCASDGCIPQPETAAPVSECRNHQLGLDSASGDGVLRTNQLMQWEHHGKPLDPCVVEASGLKSAEDIITFVFRNKVNM